MPTYEYECEGCGHRFERFQAITDEPLRKCPACGGKVRRLIGAGAGVIFKGSGFYITDYKRSGGGSDKGGSDAGGGKPKAGKAEGETVGEGPGKGGDGAADGGTE